ncbi:lipopolysaccharide biosynthesis protein [Curtobacterium aetherium]|uniref:lipopolysaccharide biosynthesis protein n=1 Tax=Curtobacterium aetherium TaxID=2841594 RepID=UPI003B52EF23
MLFLVGSRGIAAILQALSFMILSRVVDLRTFGVIGVLTGVAAFALLITDVGVTATLARARATNQDALVRGALRLNDVITVASAIVFGTVTGLFVQPWLAVAILVVALTVERNAETHLSLFYAEGARLVPSISILGRRATMLATFAGLSVVEVDGALAFALGMLTGAVFSQLIQRVTVRRSYRDSQAASFRQVFSGSWRFWVSSVLNQIRTVDSAVVGAFASVASAGLYAASQKLVNPLLLLPASLSQILLPAVARQGADVGKITKRVCLLFLSCYLPIIPLTFFAGDVLAFLFGKPYDGGASILIWAMLGFPLMALSGPLAAILQGLGREGFVAWNGLLFAVLAIAGMLVGVTVAGATGVAAGLTIAYAVRAPILVARIARERREAARTERAGDESLAI